MSVQVIRLLQVMLSATTTMRTNSGFHVHLDNIGFHAQRWTAWAYSGKVMDIHIQLSMSTSYIPMSDGYALLVDPLHGENHYEFPRAISSAGECGAYFDYIHQWVFPVYVLSPGNPTITRNPSFVFLRSPSASTSSRTFDIHLAPPQRWTRRLRKASSSRKFSSKSAPTTDRYQNSTLRFTKYRPMGSPSQADGFITSVPCSSSFFS